ncbi:DUF3306 domain-containing protein [Aquincola sp. S2]|uniref:DUF3306 domain-containing protein n=1 Tax=Pseudaquabacterium terrae TaxID=2732868 RepID=A0ABX2EQ16_9BURK|nr:DUF3306 domain-containing protein [Aquabacterium terrae]NRF70741.1 DUF3306 domain-containing protein [Aquabacterium terrae]
MADDTPFLARWSRRKVQARRGHPAEPAATDVEAVVPLPPDPAATPLAVAARAEPDVQARPPVAEPLPTHADVAQLTRDSDFSRFVAPGIDEGVKQAAMKKLFSDPHFNVMDGLDTYIDDYNKPDPIPMAMLRQMTQSKALRLFDLEEETPAAVDVAAERPALELADAASPDPEATHDDHADLQLQQDHALGRPEPGQGTGA